MNLPFFISSRIYQENTGSFSSTISKIAIGSVAIGLAAVLIAYMILGGFQQIIEDKIYSFAGHLHVTKYTLASALEDEPISTNSYFYTHYEELDFVDQVSSFAFKAGLLKTKEEVQGIIIKGLDRDYDHERFASLIVEGEFPNLPDSGYSREVMISQKMSTLLRLGVGDEAIVYFVQNPPRYRPISVSGIFKTDLEDFDDKFIIGDIGLIRRMNNWADTLVGGFEVRIHPWMDTSEAEDVLFGYIDYDLYVDKVSDKYLQIFDWLGLLDRNLVIFLWLILFVAAFNMVSILLILIMERTQMIGMLKSFGAGFKLLRRIFVLNGTLLIFRGMVLGNAIAIGLGVLQYYFKVIPLDPTNYYMTYVPIQWNWPMIIGLNIATFIVINLTLILPTFIIARINPINTIRFN